MKRKIYACCLFLVVVALTCKGQYTFVTPYPHASLSCQVGVNDLSSENFRNDIKRAVFRMQLVEANGNLASCTGTLINRNTDQNNLGQYFITAWHCFTTGDCTGGVFDFANQYITMTFNYQSPIDESGLVFSQNPMGQVYSISRKVRLVDHVGCAYGDYAICQILGDPIPPYYNVYYAGWNPNGIFVAGLSDYASIHHPRGDIKMMAGTNVVVNNSGGNFVATGCRVVTKIIDALLGWLWGHKWSTEVVCGYLEIPYAGTRLTVPSFSYGLTEDGSSGSGIFNPSNKMVGQLSGGPASSCSGSTLAFYGKLSSVYYRQTIKNTMNPSNSYGVDLSGINGRQVSCYPQVNLDPGTGPDFILYPANLYQADNHIVLSAQTTFTTAPGKKVVVKDGADFTFQAGQSITLNPGFEVERGTLGANFSAVITPSPCNLSTVNAYEAPPAIGTARQLGQDSVSSLAFKKFDINKYIKKEDNAVNTSDNVTRFNVYPNPSGGILKVDLFFKEKESQLNLTLYDLNGKPVYSRNYNNLYYLQQQLDLPQLPAGMYSLVVRTEKQVYSRRVVVMH